MTAEEMSELNC